MERVELKNIPVIICTCMSSAKYVLNEYKFCACLVDETSQIIEPETLLPILKAFDHFVLVGDHQ